MRHIHWPSSEQFRTVVKNVQHRASYIGMDSDGSAIIDKSRKSPTLRYEGTVKLHGTCSAVGISSGVEMWYQSRENIITPEKDNAGFAMFAHSKQDIFFDIAIDALEALAFVTDPF